MENSEHSQKGREDREVTLRIFLNELDSIGLPVDNSFGNIDNENPHHQSPALDTVSYTYDDLANEVSCWLEGEKPPVLTHANGVLNIYERPMSDLGKNIDIAWNAAASIKRHLPQLVGQRRSLHSQWDVHYRELKLWSTLTNYCEAHVKPLSRMDNLRRQVQQFESKGYFFRDKKELSEDTCNSVEKLLKELSAHMMELETQTALPLNVSAAREYAKMYRSLVTGLHDHLVAQLEHHMGDLIIEYVSPPNFLNSLTDQLQKLCETPNLFSRLFAVCDRHAEEVSTDEDPILELRVQVVAAVARWHITQVVPVLSNYCKKLLQSKDIEDHRLHSAVATIVSVIDALDRSQTALLQRDFSHNAQMAALWEAIANALYKAVHPCILRATSVRELSILAVALSVDNVGAFAHLAGVRQLRTAIACLKHQWLVIRAETSFQSQAALHAEHPIDKWLPRMDDDSAVYSTVYPPVMAILTTILTVQPLAEWEVYLVIAQAAARTAMECVGNALESLSLDGPGNRTMVSLFEVRHAALLSATLNVSHCANADAFRVKCSDAGRLSVESAIYTAAESWLLRSTERLVATVAISIAAPLTSVLGLLKHHIKDPLLDFPDRLKKLGEELRLELSESLPRTIGIIEDYLRGRSLDSAERGEEHQRLTISLPLKILETITSPLACSIYEHARYADCCLSRHKVESAVLLEAQWPTLEEIHKLIDAASQNALSNYSQLLDRSTPQEGKDEASDNP